MWASAGVASDTREVGREGVEPPNGVAELIYSQRPLATWIPVQSFNEHAQLQSRRRGLNSRPSAYKADALPLSYVGMSTSDKHASRAKTSSPLRRHYTIRNNWVKIRAASLRK